MSKDNLMIWHQRLGHTGRSRLIATLKANNLLPKNLKYDSMCNICFKGKMVDRPSNCTHPVNTPNQIVSIDILDLGKDNRSVRDYRYVLIIIDHFSSYITAYLLKDRSNCITYISEWYTFIKNQMPNYPVKTLLGDGEFITNELLEFCSKNGIKHDTSEAYVSQHNGLTERHIRSISEMVRCLLFDSNFDKSYWCYATMFAVYVINRLGKSRLKWQAPFYVYFGEKQWYRIQHIRKFGSVGWMRRNPKNVNNKDKLEHRAIRIRLIGFGDTSPQYTSRGTYHVMDDSGKTYYSRNCIFNELEAESTNDQLNKIKDLELSTELTNLNIQELNTSYDNSEDNTFECVEIPIIDRNKRNPTRSSRNKNPIMTVTVSNKINFDEINPREVIIPMSYKQAMLSVYKEHWKVATDKEYNSIIEREVYELVPRLSMPKGKKTVKCRWVYKLKLQPNGWIERFKARLCAKGFTQKFQTDFFDTYAPVVEITSFFYMLAWAVGSNYELVQVDVKTAFLYGELEEEIYMEQPEGYIKPGDEDKVCRLRKSLYGLKQAPLCWNKKLNEHLTKSMTFKRLTSEVCLYKRDGINILVYVDDFLIIAKTKDHADKIYQEISKEFQCTYIGYPEGMLGMLFQRVPGGLIVHQTLYVDSLLARFNMTESKGKNIPLSPSVNYYNVDDENESVKLYQELLGCLLFISIRTRPDIAHSVTLLARFTNNPKKLHYTGLKSILRYLKQTRNYGLFFRSNTNGALDVKVHHHELHGYTDASFADVISDKRKSSNGYVITLNGTAISWKATKSTIVAQSTCESEYIGMCQLTKQIMWIRNLRLELGHQTVNDTIQAYCDNQSALSFSKNTINKSGMKHIDLKYYFTKEAIERKLIKFDYIPTEDMLADMFTKVLDQTKFVKNRDRIGVLRIPDNLTMVYKPIQSDELSD